MALPVAPPIPTFFRAFLALVAASQGDFWNVREASLFLFDSTTQHKSRNAIKNTS